jgi:hypothetical protein
MHNELRYQAKTHAISEKLSKERNKVPHLLPKFFFLLKNEKEKKQQRHAYGKGNVSRENQRK